MVMSAGNLQQDLLKATTRESEGPSKAKAPSDFANRELLEVHYGKHGGEFKGAYKNVDEYLEGARDVVKNGIKEQYEY